MLSFCFLLMRVYIIDVTLFLSATKNNFQLQIIPFVHQIQFTTNLYFPSLLLYICLFTFLFIGTMIIAPTVPANRPHKEIEIHPRNSSSSILISIYCRFIADPTQPWEHWWIQFFLRLRETTGTGGTKRIKQAKGVYV